MASSVVDVMGSVDICTELAQADLGDERRNRRAQLIVNAMAYRPESSIPKIFDQEHDLEAYYRFVRNDAVDWKKILEPHFAATAKRSGVLKKVLVLHDTTEMSFPIRDEYLREDLARCSSKTQGFSLHASLCCSADGLRAALGLVAAQPFVHQKEIASAAEPKKARAFWQRQGGLYDNEQLRWFESIERAEERLVAQNAKPIHVLDREGDNYALFDHNLSRGYHFVIRLCLKRRIKAGPDAADGLESLSEALAASDSMGTRQIELSPRTKQRREPVKKRFPSRRRRSARLEFRAKQVVLPRPASQPKERAESLTVWVVEARESAPPEGEAPINWLLVTDQPCETIEQVLKVVDIYRARWLVEEFFKALKTGQSYEELQHRSATTLLNALALKSVIAWQVLVLRYFGTHHPGLPAAIVVTAIQLIILKHQKPKLFKADEPTVEEAMLAVASLGGHIKQNGTPGWLVLSRGLECLMELGHGWAIAVEHAQKM